MSLSPRQRDVLAKAVYEDHPCDDTTGCDIAVALENGFTEAAAILLTGATETPAIDALNLTIPGYQSPEFDKWADWYRKHGHECPSCESFMFADEFPVTCTNCLAAVE